MFGNRCSPVRFTGPKRYREVPIKLEELPKIDFVLISHNHYDHLCFQVSPFPLSLLPFDAISHFTKQTAEFLAKNQKDVVWIVPAGLKVWCESVGISRCLELEWWQSAKISDTLTVVGAPCQHWSKSKDLREKQKSEDGVVVESLSSKDSSADP